MSSTIEEDIQNHSVQHDPDPVLPIPPSAFSLPPSQDWRWVLFFLSTSLVIEVISFSQVGAFVPLYLQQELRLSREDTAFWTGLIAGMPLLIALIFAPFWGVWAERYSAKLIMLRAQAFELIVYIGMVFATTLPQFFGAALLLGLTYGNVAVLMAVLAKVTPRHRVGFAITTSQAMVPLGTSLGPLFGSLVIEQIGLRGLFAINAFLVVISASFIAFGVREPPRVARGYGVLQHLRLTAGQAWQLLPIRWVFLTMFFLVAGQSLVQPYIPIFLGRYFQGEELARAIGWVLGSLGVVSVIVTPLVGVLGDRIGHERLSPIAFVLLGAIHSALFFAIGPVGLIGLLFLRSVPLGSAMGNLNTSLAIRAPADNRAALISLAPFPRNLAMFVGPALGALIAPINLDLLFPVAAALLFAGAASAGLLRKSV